MENFNIDIIKAFNCSGKPEKLDGGQRQSYKVGDLVFKPIDDRERYSSNCGILLQIECSGFRLSMPQTSIYGDFVYKGWAATKFEPGEHINGNWREKLEIAGKFHGALKKLSNIDILKGEDIWSKAHSIAWEETKLPDDIDDGIQRHLNILFTNYRKLDYINQIIHGDLCGNILFHKDHEPLIIDFSPSLRPREYAESILIADAIAWENAPVSIIELLPVSIKYKQMLLRAVNFRLIVDALFYKDNYDLFFEDFSRFEPLIEKLL
ncbi:MAG: hypothetical protein KAU17_02135 [Spirochaetales bacterium]|jgi:uncharacterized protein (TIGR02569 family)|nr:hypothetical protein [Spirochaetales bacterium]